MLRIYIIKWDGWDGNICRHFLFEHCFAVAIICWVNVEWLPNFVAFSHLRAVGAIKASKEAGNVVIQRGCHVLPTHPPLTFNLDWCSHFFSPAPLLTTSPRILSHYKTSHFKVLCRWEKIFQIILWQTVTSKLIWTLSFDGLWSNLASPWYIKSSRASISVFFTPRK